MYARYDRPYVVLHHAALLAYQHADFPAYIIETGIAPTMLAAQFSHWRSGFGMLKDGYYLAVGKT